MDASRTAPEVVAAVVGRDVVELVEVGALAARGYTGRLSVHGALEHRLARLL